MENDDLEEITQNLNSWRLSNESNNFLWPNLSSSTVGASLSWLQPSVPPPNSLLSPSSFLHQQRQELQSSDPELPMRLRMRTFDDQLGISSNNNNNYYNNNNNIIGQPIPYNSRQTTPTSSFLRRDYSLPSSSYPYSPYSHTNDYGVTTNSYSSQYYHGNPSQNDLPLPYNYSGNPNGLLSKPQAQNCHCGGRCYSSSGHVASSSSNPFPQIPHPSQEDLELIMLNNFYHEYYFKSILDKNMGLLSGGLHLGGNHHHHRRSPALGSVEEARGRVAEVARDKSNSRTLGDKLLKGSVEEVEMVAEEIIMDLKSLSVHQNGFYVVQSLLQVVGEWRLEDIIHIFIADSEHLSTICTDDNGSKVMTKLVERLNGHRHKQNLLIGSLCNFTKTLSVNSNCKIFLDTCFSTFSYDVLEPFLLIVTLNFMNLAMDKNGCCVLQSCIGLSFNQSTGDGILDSLIKKVIVYSCTLSDHSFGNYVMQCVIELKEPNTNCRISEKLRGKMSTLSMNKGSSNVVEKLILYTEKNISEGIIVEIMESSSFLEICEDKYGNYVAQTALKHSKENGMWVYRKLCDLVNRNVEKLRSSEYGNNVVKTAKGEKKTKILRFN